MYYEKLISDPEFKARDRGALCEKLFGDQLTREYAHRGYTIVSNLTYFNPRHPVFIGEIDFVLIDSRNEIVAVFEVKCSVHEQRSRKHAEVQLQRFKNYLFWLEWSAPRLHTPCVLSAFVSGEPRNFACSAFRYADYVYVHPRSRLHRYGPELIDLTLREINQLFVQLEQAWGKRRNLAL